MVAAYLHVNFLFRKFIYLKKKKSDISSLHLVYYLLCMKAVNLKTLTTDLYDNQTQFYNIWA